MKKHVLFTSALLSVGAALAATSPAWLPQSLFRSETTQVAAAAANQANSAQPTAESTATDVTSQYVKNASFEADDASTLKAVNNSSDGLRGYTADKLTGWTLSGTSVTNLLVTKDCYADNNFGLMTTIPDGSQAYYLRQGWSTGTTTLQQTLSALPAGKYKLTAAVRTAYANSAASTFSLFAAKAGASNPMEKTSASFAQGSTNCFPTMEWGTHELTFELDADADVQIGLSVDWLSGGSCIAIDNVQLYRLPDSYVKPEEPTEADVESPTEGKIDANFVGEQAMKDDLMAMLGKFAQYLKNDYQDCQAANSVGEACGAFKSNSTMTNGEDGVRPNADLSMICAFLAKYGKATEERTGKSILPSGVSWTDVEQMAMKSLVYAYSTHKANKLKVCSGNTYWGSTSTSDNVWESSLWAMSVAYSAFFQWDKLSDKQKGYIETLLKAECNYELARSIPTGYNGDTKAEENGWEADVLAATLGLFPDDALASKWFDRLRLFAVNSYSHASDASDQTVLDPHYDKKTVADLYKGQNLFDDYTLQNHNFFHTSYQNVVMQELGEAALALKLFQLGTKGEEKWHTNALMHNNDRVMKQVLNWLALADGELAMPNGNDWSLFLYDQITSYSTAACFLSDPDALMLENLAYKNIKARQTTTSDGSWLLRADVGARRMGVQAHRVMMTWLMHEALSTEKLTPTVWDSFANQYAAAKIFPCQNIVRACTPERFTTFSWSTGKQSYTGYIAANMPDKNKVVVPFRANNTGNFLGWYTVNGKSTNATPVVSGIYSLRGNSYTMNGELNTNDATLNNHFAIYSTPGAAVIYTDYVRANTAATVTSRQGGLMAISTDEFTKLKRTLYYADTHTQADGSQLLKVNSPWVNVDNVLGVVNAGDSLMAFGDRAENNSVMTSKLYTSYSSGSESYKAGDVVDRRNIVYYYNAFHGAPSTKLAATLTVNLRDSLSEGWNGVIAPDVTDGKVSGLYMLLANFCGDTHTSLQGVAWNGQAPVFSVPTVISHNASSATFAVDPNHSLGETLCYCLEATDVKAQQDAADSAAVYVQNLSGKANAVTVNFYGSGTAHTKELTLKKDQIVRISRADGNFVVEETDTFPAEAADAMEGYTDVTDSYLKNPSFEADKTYGDATGNVTLGNVTYNPCYVNTVSASDKNFINVLPVTDWTPAASLNGSSNYCRMYSMPYSATMYCVSPSSQGNYAAQCAAPALDADCGNRCLTVLNSWSSGANAVTQSVALPAGDYRLVFDMKYECTNQSANEGSVVRTSGGNVNTSLTGVKTASAADYRYPSQPNEWQQMVYDFTLAAPQSVTFSLGYSTSASQGAANNTLLYIDHLRLGKKSATGIASATELSAPSSKGVYTLGGVRVARAEKGVYVVDGRKTVVK